MRKNYVAATHSIGRAAVHLWWDCFCVELKTKRIAFITEYLKDFNATQAAIRAGYSANTAESQGSRLLSNAKIAKAIADAVERRAARVEVKADDILRELLMLARTDIGKAYDVNGRLLPVHEMPEDVRRAISSIEVLEEHEGSGAERVKIGEVRKVKFWDKVKGLELLGKHLKLFTDKIEHSADEKTLEQLVLASMKGKDDQ